MTIGRAYLVLAVVFAATPALAWQSSDGTRHVCKTSSLADGQVREDYSTPNGATMRNVAAYATLDSSFRPVIYFDPSKLANLVAPIDKFLFYHECAHHWTQDNSDAKEARADCE